MDHVDLQNAVWWRRPAQVLWTCIGSDWVAETIIDNLCRSSTQMYWYFHQTLEGHKKHIQSSRTLRTEVKSFVFTVSAVFYNFSWRENFKSALLIKATTEEIFPISVLNLQKYKTQALLMRQPGYQEWGKLTNSPKSCLPALQRKQQSLKTFYSRYLSHAEEKQSHSSPDNPLRDILCRLADRPPPHLLRYLEWACTY